jgi:flavin reductase (DIM6/NTAB) family NADH-FMN oxidoreductase RutF
MSHSPVLGRLPSGIYVLTTRKEANETGMLASWVMQAGFDPPMITVAVRQDRYVAQWLSEGQSFVLNVLSHQQKEMLGHFGRGFEPGATAFEGLATERTLSGLPILVGTLGHLECAPVNHMDSADHRIFLAEVVGGQLQSEERPMVHIRKTGLHY